MATKSTKGFWSKMFAEGTSDTISSKRVTMFLAMLMLIGLSIASALGYNCDSSYIYIFGGLVTGQAGLSTVEKCAKGISKAKIEVARAEYADKNGNGIPDIEEDEEVL